jgi:hypothetical protein
MIHKVHQISASKTTPPSTTLQPLTTPTTLGHAAITSKEEDGLQLTGFVAQQGSMSSKTNYILTFTSWAYGDNQHEFTFYSSYDTSSRTSISRVYQDGFVEKPVYVDISKQHGGNGTKGRARPAKLAPPPIPTNNTGQYFPAGLSGSL